MFEKVHDRVRVLAGFDWDKGRVKVSPYLVDWRGQRYQLQTFGLHHRARRGETPIHVFEYTASGIKFRLELDTETLEWVLTEVYHDYCA